MKTPKTLKSALERGFVKKSHYINNSATIPSKVRIDLIHRNTTTFASFWVSRKYAERLGFHNAY
jgi:hypothetical protein